MRVIDNLHNRTKIVIIVGPTASGKSDLAIKIARKYNGEIISADSRQVYHGMDIGTGKVTKKEQRLIKHYLLDVVPPKIVFTADDFKKIGQKAIDEILSKNKIPIIVGGAGFYVDVLLGRMTTADVPPNPKLRAKLEKQSTEQLYNQLLTIDSRHAQEIDRNNKRRLIRALEIVGAIGKIPPPSLQSSQDRIFWLGLKPNNLEDKIKIRLDKRLGQKMIEEVKRLHKQGVSWKRFNDLGLEYRQISRYLTDKKFKVNLHPKLRSKERLKNFKNSEYYEQLLRDIIRYSKRQMTWFRKNKDINWITSFKQAEKIIKRELK